MPNTVSFQVGTAYTKKRKRMAGTNSVRKAEIKQWNPRQPNETDTYGGVNIRNLLTRNLFEVGGCSSWLPMRIFMPSVGANSYQRIGKRIFLKYLRFKGYINVEQKMVVGARWRLRLLRTNNYTFTIPSTAAAAQTAIIEYLNLLKNNESYAAGSASWDNTDTIRTISIHNFYKTVKKVEDVNIMRSKVIASGYIPVSEPDHATTYDGSLTGNAAGVIRLTGYSNYDVSFDGGRYCIPIDVKVKCNDYIDETDVRYYYVLETDCGVGVTTAVDGSPALSLGTTTYLFSLSFFIRGYFTDC